MLSRRLVAQLSESSVTKFLLHALSKLVRLAQETPCSSLLGAFALMVHVTVRSCVTRRSGSLNSGIGLPMRLPEPGALIESFITSLLATVWPLRQHTANPTARVSYITNVPRDQVHVDMHA